MKFLLLIVAIIVAVLIFRMLRASSQSTVKPSSPPKRVTTETAVSSGSSAYHAVSIKCGPGACEPALALGGERLLSSRIPRFPLPDCDSADCQCTFEHFDDRREDGSDKRAPATLRSELYASSERPERRTGSGRRKGDAE